MKRFYKCTAFLLLCFMLCPGFRVKAAEDYTATTMRLLHYEGEVEILDSSGNTGLVMENIRLNSGESLSTGEDSMAAIGLDADKILTMDENSRVEFVKRSNALELNLTDGSLLLDVQEKLGEDETLNIQTSNMVVGIRGTIVYVSNSPDASGKAGTTLGVLEGNAEVSYKSADGIQRIQRVPSGQKAVITESESLEIAEMGAEEFPEFVTRQLEKDEVLADRVEKGMEAGQNQSGDPSGNYAADGGWTWNQEVTLVAQSASKLYDGTPLTRPGDVLVYGLPESFSIRTSAGGSLTDAGTGPNPIAGYTIYNVRGEDVTRHFTNITRVDGLLRVDPAPATVWTGSAEKVYDGLPLTNEEALLRTAPGFRKDDPVWRNASYSFTEFNEQSIDSQTLYGVCGTILVHGTNPLTGETREIELFAGQKLMVRLLKDTDGQSLEYVIVTISEEDLPEEILRLYADNKELMKQACQDAGWNREKLEELIRQLPASTKEKTQKNDLLVETDSSDQLMRDATNVRITIDTDITSFNGRMLGDEEAHFVPIDLDDSIVVKATGSQTNVGESLNTYTIDWGSANPDNYILSEELGTLKVTAAEAVVTTGSASKEYDGTPLTNPEASITGLVNGETAIVTATGSQTEAGRSMNTYTIDWGSTDSGNYVLTEQPGTLEVTENAAEITLTANSFSKPYDGTALVVGNAEASASEETSAESLPSEIEPEEVPSAGAALSEELVTATGLPDGFTFTAEVTGSQTKVGSSPIRITSYAIFDPEGVDATSRFKNIKIVNGTITVTVNESEITFTAASASKIYDGTELRESSFTAEGIPSGLSFVAETSGGQKDAGSSDNLVVSWKILDGDGEDVTDAFSGIKTVKGTLTVSPAPATVTTGSASKVFDGTPLMASDASITGLADSDKDLVTVTADGTITDIGSVTNTYTIDWGSVNKDNYTLTESLGTLEVTENGEEIIFTAGSASKTYDGTELTESGVTVSGLPSGMSFVAETSGSQKDVGSSDNIVSSYRILNGSEEDVTGSFPNIKTVKGTLTVSPAPATVTTGSASKVFDGTPLTASDASITGLADSDKDLVTVTADGTITDIGSVTNTYTIDWGSVNKDNYTLTESLGTLEVSENGEEIIFTAGSASKPYDGTELTESGVTVSGLPSGMSFVAETSGSQKDVGSSDNIVISYRILNGSEEDVTGSFPNIKTVKGTLTVSPAPATVTTGSASKVFDGTPLTASDASITGLADSDKDLVTVTADGTITDIGSVPNTYTIDWGTVNKDNYTLTEGLGTLEVTENGEEIIFTAGSASKAYDGTELTEKSVTATGLPSGMLFVAETSGSQKDVGSSDNIVSSYRILNSSEEDVTSSFPNIKTVKGTLSVSPAPATVTTGSASKVFDGTPLTASDASITGLADSDKDLVTVTADGTITDIGSVTNTYTIDWGSVNKDNYTLTESLGTLEVTENGEEIIFTAGSASKAYDGTELTEESVTATGLPSGMLFVAETSGSQKDIGSSDNIVSGYRILNSSEEDVTSSFTNIKTVKGTLTVTKNDDPIVITAPSHTWTYNGEELAVLGGSTVTGLPEGLNIMMTAGGSRKDVGTTVTSVSYYIMNPEYTEDVTDCFTNITVVNGLLTCTPAEVTVTTGSATKGYDGTPLTAAESGAAASISGLAENDKDGVTVTATGSISEFGTAVNTYTIDWGSVNKNNYTLTEDLGTLTLAKMELIVDLGGETAVYDGHGHGRGMDVVYGTGDHAGERPEAINATVYDGEGQILELRLLSGDEIRIEMNASAFDAGTYEIEHSVTFTSGDASNYKFTYQNGTIRIDPRPVTITTGSASKVYDGTPLTCSEVNVEVDGPGYLDIELATITATGSQTEVGESFNTYSIDWGYVWPDNYVLTDNLGTLKVEKEEILIEPVGAAEEAVEETAEEAVEETPEEVVPVGSSAGESEKGSSEETELKEDDSAEGDRENSDTVGENT